jgi:hypothetical protein
MKPLLLIPVLLLSGCIIRKEVYIQVQGSSDTGLIINVSGSDLEDVKPKLSVPFIP